MPHEKAAMLEQFAGECELLGGLHHPCIVQFLGVWYEQANIVLLPSEMPFTLRRLAVKRPEWICYRYRPVSADICGYIDNKKAKKKTTKKKQKHTTVHASYHHKNLIQQHCFLPPASPPTPGQAAAEEVC